MSKYLLLLSLIFLNACGIFERNSEDKRAQQMINSLSAYEREALSAFFRVLLEGECCGYSLYGEKPLCVQEFIKDEIPFAMNEDLIKRSCLLREGIRIWEKSGLALLNSNYSIQASQSPTLEGWIDLFFINKQAFLNVVDRNLPLFQYVLGPKVTSHSLLNQFLDSRQNLASIFYEDRVLNGLILGYGTQNALYGSRMEYLHEYLNANVSGIETQKFSGIQNSSPSFGFSNILEEMDHLKNELFITTHKTEDLPRLPWFGAIANEETDRLLAAYKITQKKLKHVLASSHFLEEVLFQFFGYRLILPVSESTFEELLLEKLQKEKDIPILIGQDLRSNLQKENATIREIKCFTRGLLDVSGEREDLGHLLRKYTVNSPSEEKESLLYRLGQKIGDQYRTLGSIVSVEEIAARILETEKNQIHKQNQREIIDQANLLAR